MAQAAYYAETAAERALELSALAEAVAFYRQAFSLEPTPGRRMGLGHALYMGGDLEGARETLRLALDEFEAADDPMGAAHASLALAENYLPSGQGDQVIEWAERALDILGTGVDPAAVARAHYLLGAGAVQAAGSLAEAEAHLLKAAALADEYELLEMSARSQFERGNLLAQRGDLVGAVGAFQETITLAQSGGLRFLELLGLNNLAYHSLLAGDPVTAREHVEAGLALAEEHALLVPRQYLYSTRGEIALAEDRLDEAETWLARALAEAEKYDNRLQTANIRANQGQIARARGDLDGALLALEDAHRILATITAPHLAIQVHLWLAELHLERGERAAAEEALAWAEADLAGSERGGLREWAERLRVELEAAGIKT
jgi:tetratricopeptide (TPR) repeat protein